MADKKESILLVEKDPEIYDLIAHQALKPLGFQVLSAEDAGEAIRKAIEYSPDVIIANINLPGLSGKDLLVALTSQGLDSPVIVIAGEGMEDEVIRTFRLGAADYLSWPFREAEVVSAVERVVERVRTRRERTALAQEVRKTNQELKQRIKELTTLFGVGKAVTSVTNQQELFQNIIDSAMYVTDADRGWLLLRDDEQKKFILRAYKNLPETITAKLNTAWDDGISSLVAVSGETLAIHGKSLGRFKVSRLGGSIVIVPINVKEDPVGILVLVREKPIPFSRSTQKLLEAVSDYASISLVNVRLFAALEEKAHSLKQAVDIARNSEQVKTDMLQNISHELEPPLESIQKSLRVLEKNTTRALKKRGQKALATMQKDISEISQILQAVQSLQEAVGAQAPVTVNLKDIIREALSRHRSEAQRKGISLYAELPAEEIQAFAAPSQISSILDALLSNAIKFNREEGEITVQVSKRKSGQPRISVQDTGIGIPEQEVQQIFNPFYQSNDPARSQQGGLGIGLALAKTLIESQGGTIQVESKVGKGSTFHVTLQSPRKPS